MCGRYTLTISGHDLAREFSTDPGELTDWQPAFSIAPSNRVPIAGSTSKKTESYTES